MIPSETQVGKLLVMSDPALGSTVVKKGLLAKEAKKNFDTGNPEKDYQDAVEWAGKHQNI